MKWTILGLVILGVALNLLAGYVVTDTALRAAMAGASVLLMAAPGLFNLFAGERRASESREERLRTEIRDKLGLAVTSLFPGEDSQAIRSNVMIPHGEGLELAFRWNMDTWPDRDLSLESGEGVAGAALERALSESHARRWRPIVAKEIREEDLTRWNLRRDVEEKTRHVRWVVSIPILERDTLSILGVLNFDGVKPLRDPALLERRDFYDRCATFAEVIGAILEGGAESAA